MNNIIATLLKQAVQMLKGHAIGVMKKEGLKAIRTSLSSGESVNVSFSSVQTLTTRVNNRWFVGTRSQL
jgi:hypothetical protein